ncbi:MAG: hydroxyacid dehydrogenase, partial [Verrucomicrobia bacterium]|nr:hydroxyacid dehydrogenase [Verrucomicrobiota bacterium]
MKRILIIQPLRPEGLEVFATRKDVSYKVLTDFSEETILANAGDADAITVRTAVITKRVLDAAPGLKIISRHGV